MCTYMICFFVCLYLQNPESRYSPAQKAVVLVFSKSIEGEIEKDSGSSKGSSVTARLLVPSNQVGCLLGKGGVIISEIRKTTGASIKIFSGNQVPKCASANNEVVLVWLCFFVYLEMLQQHLFF